MVKHRMSRGPGSGNRYLAAQKQGGHLLLGVYLCGFFQSYERPRLLRFIEHVRFKKHTTRLVWEYGSFCRAAMCICYGKMESGIANRNGTCAPWRFHSILEEQQYRTFCLVFGLDQGWSRHNYRVKISKFTTAHQWYWGTNRTDRFRKPIPKPQTNLFGSNRGRVPGPVEPRHALAPPKNNECGGSAEPRHALAHPKNNECGGSVEPRHALALQWRILYFR